MGKRRAIGEVDTTEVSIVDSCTGEVGIREVGISGVHVIEAGLTHIGTAERRLPDDCRVQPRSDERTLLKAIDAD